MPAWSWAGASCRGVSHAKTETRKQDALSCFSANDGGVLVAIVSDGAGSASHGGEGASLVCRTLGGALRAHFRTGSGMPDDERIWQWVDDARDRIALAAGQRALSPRDFAATMVMIASDGDQTVVAHVGDGAAVARVEGEWKAVSWPEQGEYASTTFFVTDDTGPRMRISRHEAAVDALAVFTDGIERLALDLGKEEAFQPFFRGMIRPLDGKATGGPDRDLGFALAAYLDSPAVCERTDDDKTLILAVRR